MRGSDREHGGSVLGDAFLIWLLLVVASIGWLLNQVAP